MRRRALAAAALVLVPAAAWADTEEDLDRFWEELTGEVRAGWRFVGDEGEGRAFQDHPLLDGPRIFDLDVRGDTLREDVLLSSFDLSAHGIGDQETDARLRVGGRDLWKLDGGWSRDDFSYRATGDPFPYDTRRERADLGFRWTPSRRLTVRLDWDRSLRRGDAYTGADTDLRPFPPSGVDADLVQVHRPLRQQSDRVTLGVDAAFDGGFRASLAQSVRLAQIDDTRVYEIPASLSGSTPMFEALRREVRSPAWTTVAKAGWTSADRDLDVGAIWSYTVQPLDTRLGGSARGFDPVFDAGVARGDFREVTDGENDIDRDAVNTRVEAMWRPHADWELTAALEDESVVDDASLRLVRRRTYTRTVPGPVGDVVTRTSTDARITDRRHRASLEAQWQVRENVRLRLGEEVLRETLRVPTDTRGDDTLPTAFSSKVWRTTAGVDWEPVERLDLSLLARHAFDDEPHAPTSADVADEISFRGRWRAADALSLTTVYRHKGFRQDEDLDHAARSDSASVGAAWTDGPWSVTPNVTWQVVDTRTDTQFFDFSRGFSPIREQVSFETRNLIANVDVRYAFAKNLRAFLSASWIDSDGDYEARWDTAKLGAEHDLRDDVTVGAALLSWRLDEDGRNVDDYDAVGAEVWLTFRF